VLATLARSPRYSSHPDDAKNFRGYGQRVAEAAAASATRDVALAQAFCSVALIVLTCVACVCLFFSALSWDRYHRSRRLMMLAWLLAFAAPFAISTIPIR
jgi:hypothetical protein